MCKIIACRGSKRAEMLYFVHNFNQQPKIALSPVFQQAFSLRPWLYVSAECLPPRPSSEKLAETILTRMVLLPVSQQTPPLAAYLILALAMASLVSCLRRLQKKRITTK